MADWDRALELDPGTGAAAISSGRLGTLARLGRHAKVAAKVRMLTRTRPIEPGTLYDASCALSLGSRAVRSDTQLADTERRRLGERYATEAVALLRQVDQIGGFRQNPGLILHMNATDRDLDPLRNRPDFLGFVGDLLFPDKPFRE